MKIQNIHFRRNTAVFICMDSTRIATLLHYDSHTAASPPRGALPVATRKRIACGSRSIRSSFARTSGQSHLWHRTMIARGSHSVRSSFARPSVLALSVTARGSRGVQSSVLHVSGKSQLICQEGWIFSTSPNSDNMIIQSSESWWGLGILVSVRNVLTNEFPLDFVDPLVYFSVS